MRSYLRVLTGILVLSVAAMAGQQTKRSIAWTFDDLPLADTEHANASEVEDVNHRILDVLAKHHAPAIGFANEEKVEGSEREKRIAALDLWLNRGQQLGNHSYSHPDFNKLTLQEFIREAERGEVVLKKLLSVHGQRPEYFRYPFNHTGNDPLKKAGFEKWLSEHGYKVATCTVENTDWVFNRAYTSALAANDKEKAAKIRAAYLDFTDAKLRFFEQASLAIANREFPQVFLAHANRLNADSLDELLTRMEQSGYQFVTIQQAQSDPIYQTQDSYVGEYGPMWPYRWAPALKKKIDGRSEPEPPKWISDLAEAR